MVNKFTQKDVCLLLLAGSGSRLYQDIKVKKQFYPVNHRELYLYALDNLMKSNLFQRIVLMIDKEDKDRIVFDLKNKVELNDDTEILLVLGGKDRNESVFNGLKSLEDIQGEFPVFIHDAARPIIEKETLEELHEAILSHDAITLCLPMHDSVLKMKDNKITYVNRKDLYRVLTPQVFVYSKIYNIYKDGYDKKDTDDFKKAIKSNLDCFLLRGKSINMKVTELDDLEIIENVLKNQQAMNNDDKAK